MTCKDCLHYKVCEDELPDSELNKEMTEDCHCCYFKDKAKVVELPYPIDTQVFVIRNNKNWFVFTDFITGYYFSQDGLSIIFDYHLAEDDFSKVFTDKSKAEEKLKELNEK